MLRAKMIVTGIQTDGTTATAATYESTCLNAVYSGDPEDPNYTWSQATPSGGVRLHITNPTAMGKFEKGKTYFVDFTPAE